MNRAPVAVGALVGVSAIVCIWLYTQSHRYAIASAGDACNDSRFDGVIVPVWRRDSVRRSCGSSDRRNGTRNGGLPATACRTAVDLALPGTTGGRR